MALRGATLWIAPRVTPSSFERPIATAVARKASASFIDGGKGVSVHIKSQVAARKVTPENRGATNVEEIRVEKHRPGKKGSLEDARVREAAADAQNAEQGAANAAAQVARDEAVDRQLASAVGDADKGGPGLPLARLAPAHTLVAAATSQEQKAEAMLQARKERLARTRANLRIGGAPDKASQERLASDEAQGMIERAHETLGFVEANARKVSPRAP